MLANSGQGKWIIYGMLQHCQFLPTLGPIYTLFIALPLPRSIPTPAVDLPALVGVPPHTGTNGKALAFMPASTTFMLSQYAYIAFATAQRPGSPAKHVLPWHIT